MGTDAIDQRGRGRIILTDWVANGIPGPAAASKDDFLWYLALLCLLYDDVLVPDESIVLGKKFSEWFATDPGPLLRLLESCGLRILSQAERAYLDEDLKELSRSAPLSARAEHIRRHLTDGARPFIPDPSQLLLYARLDPTISANSHSRETVSAGSDIWETFAEQLHSILTESRDWWQGTYPGLSLATVDEYVAFMEHRERAAARVKDLPGSPVPVREPDGRIAFSRSLAYRVASKYPPREDAALTELIQSTFAAVFTDRERALGTYGSGLREIILTPFEVSPQFDSPETPRIVEALPSIPIQLASLPGVAAMDAVARVRANPAGAYLRRVVRDAGSDPEFTRQREAWLAVADLLVEELARNSPSEKRIIVIRPLMTRLGGSLIGGAFAQGLLQGPASVLPPTFALGVGLSQLIQVSGQLSLRWLRHFYDQVYMRQRLESQVTFRTASIAIADDPVARLQEAPASDDWQP